jgi:hypothetical protein
LPGSVKVARRPVKPFGVGASPTLAANLRKAGRYKLAAPVSKTGSDLRSREHYPGLPPFNYQPKGAHHDNHSSIRAEMATREAAKAHRAETKNRQQEGPTGPPNAVEPDALSNLFPGRQPFGISSTVAPVIQGSGKRKKGAASETGNPISKQIALSQELQARTHAPNQAGENQSGISAGAFRCETRNQNV